MANILVITQEYPADDIAKEFTPVVHFFTKEWVKLGYNVKVINCPSNFPSVYYRVCKPFRRKIESLLGINIRMYSIGRRKYILDDVPVLRLPLTKLKPHGRFAQKQINLAVESTIEFCEKDGFAPDAIIGHWVNPALEIMQILKKKYNVPIALVMHDAGFDFDGIYKYCYQSMIDDIDIIGYRSRAIKERFERKFGKKERWFYCYSGVPNEYVSGAVVKKDFSEVRNFIYVGLLIKRKHPNELLKALIKSSINDFRLKFIGEGAEAKAIRKILANNPLVRNKVELLGRVSREEVQSHIRASDVFVMISRGETFGLVYIEAMAAGCITIASKNEGVDGVIIDGKNGFLCEAGNVEELALIIDKIGQMSAEELEKISSNAVMTAIRMTDSNVAKEYINNILNLI